MANTKVKNNHLTYNGINYFRVGSEDTYLGCYGEKKSPIFQGNYLETQDGLPAKKLKVKNAVEATIDFSNTTEAELLANINVAGVFGVNKNTAYKDMKSGQLRLYKLIIDLEDLRKAANDSPNHLERLDSYGKDARIVSDLFVVLDANESKSFSTATSFGVSISAGVIKIEAQGGAQINGSTTVTVSDGSIFAYGLAKIKWDKNDKIEKLTDDQWGPA
jgi:hypothetical protein